MTQAQKMMWAEIKAMGKKADSMVEMTLRKEGVEQYEVIHGQLAFVPPDVEAEDAKIVIFTKDYSGGVEHSYIVLCANVAWVRSVSRRRRPPLTQRELLVITSMYVLLFISAIAGLVAMAYDTQFFSRIVSHFK